MGPSSTRGRLRVALVVVVALLGALVSSAAPLSSERAAASTSPLPADLFNANAGGQDWANSYLLAMLSHRVYLSNLDDTVDAAQGPTTEDNFEARFAAWATGFGFSNPDYYTFTVTPPGWPEVSVFDTELVKVETDDAIIFAFRGTETNFGDLNNAMDLLVDLAVAPWQGIHTGFAHAAAVALPTIRSAIAAASGKKVWLTGHSLGGADATVTSWFLQSGGPDPLHPDVVAPIPVQGVVTYGAPRVFMESRLISVVPLTFGEDMVGPYNTGFGSRTQRWVDFKDPVPQIPPGVPVLLPYKHIGQVNNIGVSGSDCTVALNDTELEYFDEDAFGSAWVQFVAAVWAWDWVEAAAALASMGQVVMNSLDVADHSITRYVDRIYAHLPVTVKAQVGLPPYPPVAEQVTACDTPDTTPPVITPQVSGTLGSDDWYRSNVTVSWDVTDSESDILSSTGCATTVVTADTAGTTFTCTATSGGGTATQSVTVKRDATPPTVTLSTPPSGGADYLLSQAVLADYSCTDAGSGAASCVGTVADGAAIDTTTFGSHNFTVTASDVAGNSATVTNPYTIAYGFSGFSPPVVSAPEVNRLRAGAKLALKWNVTDETGVAIADQPELFHVSWSNRFACSGSAGTPVIESSDTAGSSGLRWDPDASQYVFVAASDRADAGYCRFLVLDAGSGRRAQTLVQLVG